MKLSVIIPDFKTPPEVLARCRRSIRFPNAEILVVSGHGGPSDNRNAGLARAQGEYIAFVDSDDECLGDALEKAVDGLDLSGADIAIFGFETLWPEEGLRRETTIAKAGLKAGYAMTLESTQFKALYKADLMNVVWNKVYRRSFLTRENIRFNPDAITGEDLLFNLDCQLAKAKWILLDDVGYRYYRTGVSLLSRYKAKLQEGFAATNEKWRQIFDEDLYPPQTLAATVAKNKWRPGSPFWLAPIYGWLRRVLYVRQVRRWNLKRAFPDVEDIGG